MSKIWALYNMEFKRIYKLYFTTLGFMILANILGIGLSLYNTERSIDVDHIGFSLELLKSKQGISNINSFTTVDIYGYGCIILGIVVLLCLMYAIGIWYRDYFSRNKTIYTLLSLPQPKFNIFVAKFITIVVMIYGAIVVQFLMWYIDLNFVKLLVGINNPSFTNIFANMMQRVETITIVAPYIMEYLMINVVGVIVTVLVIFTGILIERSFKKTGAIVGIIYIVAYVVVFFMLAFLAAIKGDLVLTYHL
ncbi:MAG: hypothetical protein ACRC1Y_04750, partial [Paraclostridium sp.]